MKFDWVRFCDEFGVPFVAQGANVARGHINIQCPFCDDPSEHMGLRMEETSPYFGCWRCHTAGAHPYTLLLKLVGKQRAAQALQEQKEESNPDQFESLLTNRLDTSRKKRSRLEKEPPAEFRRLGAYLDPRKNRIAGYVMPYVTYLRERGFDQPLEICGLGDLHWAIPGSEYARRIIMPVYHDGRLISWVGRTIDKDTKAPRYKTEPSGDLKRCIAGYDALTTQEKPESRGLLIAEGPFDYLKLSKHMGDRGCNMTCTFGTSWTETQLALLARQVKRYGHTFVVFDLEARLQAQELVGALQEVAGTSDVTSLVVPGRKDPGEMTESDIPLLLGMMNARIGA